MNDHDEAHLFDGKIDPEEEAEWDRREAEADRAEARREITRKLVALKALTDRVKELDTELRVSGVQMFQEGDREMARIPGQDGELVELGAVTRTKSFNTVKVVDESAFFASVLLEHPEWIVQVIDPVHRKMILDQARELGAAVWPTGEEISGVLVERKAGGLQVRKAEDIAEKMPLIKWNNVLALEAPEAPPKRPTALEVCPAACHVCKDLYEPDAPPQGGALICETCPECNPALVQAAGKE